MLTPLFDALTHFTNPHKTPPALPNSLYASLRIPQAQAETEFVYANTFLWEYNGRKPTFEAYRKEIERFLLWAWIIEGVDVLSVKRDHIRSFIRFCEQPPKSWIGKTNFARFNDKDGLRIVNTNWRPFTRWKHGIESQTGTDGVLTQKKVRVLDPKKTLNNDSVQALFAILSSFYTYLDQEEISDGQNPVGALRQKSQFLAKPTKSDPRRISSLETEFVYKAAKRMAMKDPDQHARTLFAITLMLEMFMRISELCERVRYEDGERRVEWRPEMGDITRDGHGNWWLKTIGKGRKERDIALPDRVLTALKAFRAVLDLPPLPLPGETTPLIPALTTAGKPDLHRALRQTGQIREFFNDCSMAAVDLMQAAGHKAEDFTNLAGATPHWLRHTGISEAVKIRPREHVRDDAGHGSSQTTDRYIDSDRQERACSAEITNDD